MKTFQNIKDTGVAKPRYSFNASTVSDIAGHDCFMRFFKTWWGSYFETNISKVEKDDMYVITGRYIYELANVDNMFAVQQFNSVTLLSVLAHHCMYAEFGRMNGDICIFLKKNTDGCCMDIMSHLHKSYKDIVLLNVNVC